MGMSREEAAERLKTDIYKYADFTENPNENEFWMAFDMAIKALEQESQTFEWCTDCREYDQEKHCCHRWSKVIRNTVEEMKKPKVGHWIFDEILDRNYYCSECKSMGVDYWDYCPYCGARMVEPQESEEV